MEIKGGMLCVVQEATLGQNFVDRITPLGYHTLKISYIRGVIADYYSLKWMLVGCSRGWFEVIEFLLANVFNSGNFVLEYHQRLATRRFCSSFRSNNLTSVAGHLSNVRPASPWDGCPAGVRSTFVVVYDRCDWSGAVWNNQGRSLLISTACCVLCLR